MVGEHGAVCGSRVGRTQRARERRELTALPAHDRPRSERRPGGDAPEQVRSRDELGQRGFARLHAIEAQGEVGGRRRPGDQVARSCVGHAVAQRVEVVRAEAAGVVRARVAPLGRTREQHQRGRAHVHHAQSACVDHTLGVVAQSLEGLAERRRLVATSAEHETRAFGRGQRAQRSLGRGLVVAHATKHEQDVRALTDQGREPDGEVARVGGRPTQEGDVLRRWSEAQLTSVDLKGDPADAAAARRRWGQLGAAHVGRVSTDAQVAHGIAGMARKRAHGEQENGEETTAHAWPYPPWNAAPSLGSASAVPGARAARGSRAC